VLILNASRIVRETVRPSPKLTRKREKSRKAPSPLYERIDAAPYVAAILARRPARGERLCGHHTLPVPHVRRGHFREYESGIRSFIRNTLA
jgi:hypothetical protein